MNIAQLVAAGITPTLAKLFAEPLAAACERFEINTGPRQAMFVTHASHESTGFARLEESLHYSTPMRIVQMWPNRFTGLADAARYTKQPQALANHVYANRNGNDDEASGDGWRYRGRGLFQLTGRGNYAAAAEALEQPFVDAPELVSQPLHAAMTAGWYWAKGGLNAMADMRDVVAVTRAINGKALAGLDERRELYTEATRAFA